MSSGPLEAHRDAADAQSAAACQMVRVGDRQILALSDGVMVMPPNFMGTPAHPSAAHDTLQNQDGRVSLPIGCFVIPGETAVLVDAGYGPNDYLGRGSLVGGRLLEALDANGIRPADIDVIALSHLHLDHVGWVGDRDGVPVFPNAQILVGQADWDYFMVGGAAALPIPDNVRVALLALAQAGRVTLLDGDTAVAPGVTRLDAAGHTPGHSVFVVSDGGERVLLLGDALYCSQQLTETDWASTTDVDAALARRTRASLAEDLRLNGGKAVGCHFPGLRASRILGSSQ